MTIKKRKTILVIAPTPFFTDRGTPIRILEEMRAMAARGYQIDILTYPLGDRPESLPDSVQIFRCFNITPWYKKRDAGPSIEKFLLDGAMQFSLTRLRIMGNYDVIHAHLHEGIEIARKTQFISWLLGKPTLLVGDLHGSLLQEVVDSGFVKSKWVLKFVAFSERWLERSPAVIITSSEKNTKRVKQHRTKKTITLLDGVLPVERVLSKSDARKKLEIEERGQFIAAYTGGFGKEKGIDLLIETVKQSLQEQENLDWILAGNMSEARKTELGELFNVSDRVTLVPSLRYNELSHVLAAADFGIDPKPVDSKQASGKIMNYIGAGIIPIQLAKDPELFTALLTDPQLRATKLEEAQQFAATHSWETTTAPLVDIYEHNHLAL